MKKSERSSYTALDFLEWSAAGTLEISPKFQRRGVWNRQAKSYLIDTILLDMPIPPIYLRVVQDSKKQKTIREVVDGQQRISAILEFAADKFRLSPNVESEFKGKRFSELPTVERNRITQYAFICEVFYGIADHEVLHIFARLNTHSVKLNAQELRNGHYFGQFKQSAYKLSLEHLEFWRKSKILTEQNIARMQEAELTSELMILAIDGLQDKKKSIDEFYSEFDDSFSNQNRIESRFRNVIDAISETFDDQLQETEFRRPPLFYSLYGAVYHHMYGIPNCDIPTKKRRRLLSKEVDALLDSTFELSNIVYNAGHGGRVPKDLRTFVAACQKTTDNIGSRSIRLNTIFNHAF